MAEIASAATWTASAFASSHSLAALLTTHDAPSNTPEKTSVTIETACSYHAASDEPELEMQNLSPISAVAFLYVAQCARSQRSAPRPT